MTLLGMQLAFHLKYESEMRTVLDAENAPEGLDEFKQTQHLAIDVEKESRAQAETFLALCGEQLEKHFTSIGAKCLEAISQPANSDNNAG